ncbi:putative methyltransferase [Tetraselmis virus 1]|uniref:Putative methyltransferase n=1 Tax=Tetraselmis virus 1 TaxID=2060617 RepID=A0A2P0VN78_9VIRU|nr:putative methyltransferase [Tetraselmis virus 1]AUF82372.1 putative methyltransferase [Tetraselmis virus 1]
MKVLLFEDSCREAEINELGIPMLRTNNLSLLRPGDFLVMPCDLVDYGLQNKYNLRRVFSCTEDVKSEIIDILKNDILIVGKATNEIIPDYAKKLFGKICHVKCEYCNHKDPKYICTSHFAWMKNHNFLEHHNSACKVYYPVKWSKGNVTASESPNNHINYFRCDIAHKKIPELRQVQNGWLTTGMATLYHFLYDNIYPDSCFYMFRFSHWRNGSVTTPPVGMQNAFGRPPGRHDIYMEKKAAQIASNSKRVFSFELNEGGVRYPINDPQVQSVQPSSPYIIREDLIKFIFQGASVVELGVSEGNFSKKILDLSECKTVVSIDPWIGKDQEYQKAKRILNVYGKRSQIIRDKAEFAIKYFKDLSLDFVYVDTGDYNDLLLNQWWSKIRHGGIISGNNYNDKTNRLVYISVNKFASSLGVPVHIVPNNLKDRDARDKNTPYSVHPNWWIEKPLVPETAVEEDNGSHSIEDNVDPETDPYIKLWLSQHYIKTKEDLAYRIDAMLFIPNGHVPQTMLDIGCGLAYEAEYFQRKYGTRLWLLEGDRLQNTASQTRTDYYGTTESYMFFNDIQKLINCYQVRDLQYTLLSQNCDESKLPCFDLITSIDACGMHFPVSTYYRFFKKHTNPNSKVILELNNHRSLEHKKFKLLFHRVIDVLPNSKIVSAHFP